MNFKRAVIFVLDGLGVGELPDSDLFNDRGSNTLGNILKNYSLKIPNLCSLGIGYLEDSLSSLKVSNPIGFFGKMAEMSPGKDSTSGHWELMGIILKKPFPVYPDGFPQKIIKKFEELIGTPILGNIPASGTEIIKTLGKKHLETGYPIVYTSADSVFQIAAHKNVISIEKLYWMCERAREILTGEHNVSRVIARPFKGEYPDFIRINEKRKDFSLPPPEPTLLDLLKARGMSVIGVGKVGDIFAQRGFTEIILTKDNKDGLEKSIELIKREGDGLILIDLNDFDTLYGHRNNVEGYARAIEYFDSYIPEIISHLKRDDFLVFTADHGCDPTTSSTDHSREYAPLLVYSKIVKKGGFLGVRKTFSDLAQTIAENFGFKMKNGKSFFKKSFNLEL